MKKNLTEQVKALLTEALELTYKDLYEPKHLNAWELTRAIQIHTELRNRYLRLETILNYTPAINRKTGKVHYRTQIIKPREDGKIFDAINQKWISPTDSENNEDQAQK